MLLFSSIGCNRYIVTGGRKVTTILTIEANGRWSLEGGAKLHDVTHLPCRSARYVPLHGGSEEASDGKAVTVSTGSPASANPTDFPVRPGGEMPPVKGCKKQDYWVVFVVGIEKNKDSSSSSSPIKSGAKSDL